MISSVLGLIVAYLFASFFIAILFAHLTKSYDQQTFLEGFKDWILAALLSFVIGALVLGFAFLSYA